MAREKSYVSDPVVVVFKTSNRSNAQTKMKVFNNFSNIFTENLQNLDTKTCKKKH